LVHTARERLAAAGFAPALAAGDGRGGYPDGQARFDHIIATCSVLIRFRPQDDGTTLGHFTATTGNFMPAREYAHAYDQTPRTPYRPEAGRRPTPVTADTIRSTYPFRLLLALAVPRAELVYHSDDDGTWSVQLQTSDGAWARVPLGHDDPHVTESGDGGLWRTVVRPPPAPGASARKPSLLGSSVWKPSLTAAA
jgi:hypothetical protein